jgi:membrane protease YdiL (CAAX protease family)
MRHVHPKRNLRPAIVWTTADAVVVYLYCFAGAFAAYAVGRFVLQDTWWASVLGSYSGGLLGLCVPLLWIRRRRGLTKEALGLQRGYLPAWTSITLGAGLALLYHLVIRNHLYPLQTGVGTPPSYLALVFSPLSLGGVASVVLIPLSEEVLIRGLLYPPLRQTLGTRLALIVQAVVFSAPHLGTSVYSVASIAVDTFLIGLILGILYEKTESLYASIVCHVTLNYLATLGAAL